MLPYTTRPLLPQHNERLDHMRAAIDAGRIGASGVQHVSSAFNFRGDESFFGSNIRIKADADPLGCLGDLGWYCVRLSLFAFAWDMPATATAVLHAATSDGVPTSLSGVLTWAHREGDAADGSVAPRSATFHCSFTHALSQWAHLTGEEGSIELNVSSRGGGGGCGGVQCGGLVGEYSCVVRWSPEERG